MLETKSREFQQKVVNNIAFTNEKIDPPRRTFCKYEIESLEHLFYSCKMTRSFWVVLHPWLMELNINLESLSVVYVLFDIIIAVN